MEVSVTFLSSQCRLIKLMFKLKNKLGLTISVHAGNVERERHQTIEFKGVNIGLRS